MSLRLAVTTVVALFCSFTGQTSALDAPADKSPVDKPNVVIFLADDLGYGDMRVYGGEAATPNLEKLAARGALADNFYAAAPVCSPSRAGLLTGQWPMRWGIHTYIRAQRPDRDLEAEQTWLKRDALTIAELFERNGYQTSHFGKWHLGAYPASRTHPHPQPADHGFDYSFGTPNNAVPSHKNPTNFYRQGAAAGAQEGYSAQIIIRDAIDRLKISDPDTPFFHYIAFHEPHTPIASPPEIVARYAAFSPKKATYLANIENLDAAIGAYMDYLEAEGLTGNTIVIFMSDNGPIAPGSAAPLRSEKNFVYDGGIKVPAIFAGPGIVPQRISLPLHATDILPTLTSIAQIDDPLSEMRDGLNVTAWMNGDAPADRDKPMVFFFYRNTPQAAIRRGKYVLVASFDDPVARTHFISLEDLSDIQEMPDLFDTFALYDLEEDPSQSSDLSADFPDITLALKTTLVDELSSALKSAPDWTALPGREDWPTRLQNWPQE